MAILKKKAEGPVVQESPIVPETQPEQIVVPEVVEETMEGEPSMTEQSIEKTSEGMMEQPVVITAEPATQAVVSPVKDALFEQIENVLEEDMTDMFLAMSPKDQLIFKVKGEETVSKIRELFLQTKIQTKKIFELIREWLHSIPGVNRFFLEQEAKIKTDKIKHLHDQNNQQNML